jgi:hypothetical protein
MLNISEYMNDGFALRRSMNISSQGLNVLNVLPSGKRLHNYWKWPFIVDFPIKNGDFP